MAILLATSIALLASPANAWTQIDNGGDISAVCYPCYSIEPNVPHLYRTSSTWNNNWNSAMTTAFNGWNALRPPALNPVWSRTTGTGEAILLGQGALDPGECARTVPYLRDRDYAEYYATLTLPNNTYLSPTYDARYCYLTKVLAHEIGHAGEALSHSRISGNLMVQGTFDRTAPGPDDYNGIRAIYG